MPSADFAQRQRLPIVLFGVAKCARRKCVLPVLVRMIARVRSAPGFSRDHRVGGRIALQRCVFVAHFLQHVGEIDQHAQLQIGRARIGAGQDFFGGFVVRARRSVVADLLQARADARFGFGRLQV